MRKSFDLPAVFRLLKIIRELQPDVVNTHSGKDSFLAGIAGRLSSFKPLIVRTRHLAMPITSKTSYSLLPHKVVTVSEHVRNYLVGAGVADEQVVAIPTGIDIARFSAAGVSADLRKELGIAPSVPLIGTVGILRYRKGHHILLQAIPAVLQRFPDVIFLFAGNGPQEDNIRQLIAAAGLEKSVLMLGLRDDIPNLLNSIDLFVLPTLQEALGTSFLEAMAFGKAVIGCDVDGVGEVIKDGVNGFLVEPGNPGMLADRINRLLADRQLADAMGAAGKEIVMQGFTVERMCEGMLSLYQQLLAERER
jgi:glycosyltransferase involved in cell wall biosynthesis